MSRIASDTLTIFRREVLRYRRDRAYWIGQLAFPLAVVGFVGFGLNDVVVLPTGTDYVAHLASGILVLMVGSGAVGGGFSLIEDRASGFLRALLVAPVARSSIVLGKLAARLLMSLLVVGLLLGILALFTQLRLMHPGQIFFPKDMKERNVYSSWQKRRTCPETGKTLHSMKFRMSRWLVQSTYLPPFNLLFRLRR